MKKVNVYIGETVRWAAFKKDDEYQAWIDYAVANNLWGQSETYTVEVVDATVELEQIRASKEGVKKQDLDLHTTDLNNPHQVTKDQVGLSDVDNVSASSLRDRSTHTGTQLASTISDLSASTVSNTPSGNIIATTVQDAINELDVEKQPAGDYIVSLTGDVAASGPGSAVATLSNTGVVAGTYSLVTVDSKGRVTEGSNTGSITRYSYFTNAITTNSTTTYTSVGTLTTASLPVGLYYFRFAGNMQSAATANGVGVRVAPVTATMTTVSAKWNLSQGANGVSHDFEYDQIANNTNLTSASAQAANTNFSVNGFGVFRLTVAGTVAIQIRSEGNGTAITLQPDSVFILELV